MNQKDNSEMYWFSNVCQLCVLNSDEECPFSSAVECAKEYEFILKKYFKLKGNEQIGF